VYELETEDATPTKKAEYRKPFALREKMNRQVQKMFR
jgi:uncharacterized protein VirK/YbjX